MAEDKRANPYPYPTAEEVDAAPGTRQQKAARNIATRHFNGIPIRAFLLGQNDHSPVMQGLAEFTEAVYQLLDFLPIDSDSLRSPGFDEAIRRVHEMMENHGCPSAPTTEP